MNVEHAPGENVGTAVYVAHTGSARTPKDFKEKQRVSQHTTGPSERKQYPLDSHVPCFTKLCQH